MSDEEVERLANQILSKKAMIVPAAQKVGLREVLTSTKLCSLLQTAGLHISIGELKVLLKHLGFNCN